MGMGGSSHACLQYSCCAGTGGARVHIPYPPSWTMPPYPNPPIPHTPLATPYQDRRSKRRLLLSGLLIGLSFSWTWTGSCFLEPAAAAVGRAFFLTSMPPPDIGPTMMLPPGTRGDQWRYLRTVRGTVGHVAERYGIRLEQTSDHDRK